MTLHCVFIGFGKSTTRYHVAHIFRRHAKPEKQALAWLHTISPAILMTY